MNKFKSIVNIEFWKISLAVILIGLGSGYFSYFLHKIVFLTTNLIGTNDTFTIKTLFFSISFALLSYLLTKKIFKDTNGSGIPQVKLSLVAYKGEMQKRMPVGKFITSFLTLCTGLSFGKEGPLVTISAAWGHLVSHVLKLNRQITKVLVSSGATAGLAAAFNTPIAAVVFTVEEILGELNTKYLGPIIVTSVIASVCSYKLSGGHGTFSNLNYGFHVEWHLIFYLILGLFMSFIGLFFTKFILLSKEIRKRYFQKYDFVFVVFAIALAGIASLYSKEVLGDGINSINNILQGTNIDSLKYILLLFIIKFFLTTSSYSTGLSGGLFMPVLFLGALGGGAFAIALSKIGVENVDVGAFALLGMTSLLVAVIRTPFTAFVMLFEMTRDYELILPLMTSSVTAYFISSFIHPESVYESVAEYEGVHLPTHDDKECLNEMSVEECMVKKVVSLESSLKLSESIDIVSQYDFGGYPVVNKGILLGIINKSDLLDKKESGEDCNIIELLKYSTISIYPDQSLLVAMDRMKRFEIGRLPVVSRFNDRKLLGVITPKDIVNYLGIQKKVE
ncbi:MAG: chloride channel protein [Halobacteriovoraceae bacterium]|nr:chloride channel protein [Halobacteriovoraceae bacterium]